MLNTEEKIAVNKITNSIIAQLANDSNFLNVFMEVMDMSMSNANIFIRTTVQKFAIIIRKNNYISKVKLVSGTEDFYKRIRINKDRKVTFTQDVIPIPMTNTYGQNIKINPGNMVISELVDANFISKNDPETGTDRFAYICIMKQYEDDNLVNQECSLVFVTPIKLYDNTNIISDKLLDV